MTSYKNPLRVFQNINGFIVGAALLSASISVQAETDDRGWFVGGTVSNFNVKAETEEGDGFTDSTENGLSVIWGYNFNSFFGLESQFFYVDGIKHEWSYTYRDSTYYDFYKISMAGFSITPKFKARLSERFSLYGKLGLADLAYDTNAYGESWDGIVFTYGVGSEFDLTNRLKLRLSFDHYDGTLEGGDYSYYDDSDLEVDVSQIGLGMYYQF